MITELKEPLWMDTPKGKAIAKFVIDYGSQSNLLWVCFMKETGECWTFDNKYVLLDRNMTDGIRVNDK